MKYFGIKLMFFVLLTAVVVVLAVVSLVAWVLKEHLNDDWDWL